MEKEKEKVDCLAREITVVTPENIPITLELAGLGTRFGALMIDLLIQIATFVIGLILFLILAAFTSVAGLTSLWIALGIIAGFLLLVGYFILFETIWNGQTPGKRMFRLRVVRDGGYPINVFASATRNLIRIADFLPASYGIGALTVFFNPQYKRLGDMVAGTLVVKEKDANALAYMPTKRGRNTVAVPGRLPDDVKHPSEVLTPDEIALLRRFALRRWEMTPDDSERLAYRLVVPLIPRLGLTFVPGVAPRYADLVTVLAAATDAREAEAEARRI